MGVSRLLSSICRQFLSWSSTLDRGSSRESVSTQLIFPVSRQDTSPPRNRPLSPRPTATLSPTLRYKEWRFEGAWEPCPSRRRTRVRPKQDLRPVSFGEPLPARQEVFNRLATACSYPNRVILQRTMMTPVSSTVFNPIKGLRMLRRSNRAR